MSTFVQSAVQMHAHKCVACAEKGEEVIWVHPDTCRGAIAAHKCPKCGKIEWKQDKTESAKLPQVHAQTSGIPFETLLGYILLAVGLALLGYGAYLFVKERATKKALPL